MNKLIRQHQQQIRALCRKYGVRRLELFGSAASDQPLGPASDVDFFYEFEPAIDGLFDRFFGLKEELEQLLGRPVDLVSLKDVTNPYFLSIASRSRVEPYAA